ncbi:MULTISPECIES: sugar ABC transporter ATP-binding protein [Phyllobacteriaceae]|jgi:rhamnose transport system ATP-binding protein|uniref:D-xylose ABC transporter ATP-binding protein n=1 Tax=Mesorhizobium hungaricum TaxID=1566387 RepID=A0A1C2DVZ5_9HYPH|nr:MULTISPECIES: sugar ABC transporter ATP-binding protein [Mesorhizobium]MBN9234037.1 sugar ABC transporter ATP-binding protein [Mesorhizobium sp.]MDQ0331569.1 ribose transport system ATP-binding protein/rhamnose transport system ATP-binding protein [Mesorhizobium sp. YL-MeA3-2017]OCX18806.1 D-xylose ABC transporter ATP-binding protein [Mesorhizobium hungaricum]
MNAAAPYVSLAGMSKSFVGIKALKDVSFDVRPGEVHALLGENGAGKSTLIKMMSGLYAPDAGTITVDGRQVKFASTRDASAAGIATVYQELLLFPELTVAENVFLGNYPRRPGGWIDWGEVRARTRALLDQLDTFDLDVDAKVLTLSVAQRQRVEIAKALSKNARILIMDEPTASLVESDVQRLMTVVRQLRERGVGIVYVSHRMSEIFALADRVTVLRDGGFVGTRDIGEVDEAKLVSMMVGRPIDSLFPKAEAAIGDTVLEVRNLNHGRHVRDISFSLRRGEILGVAGLVGSGRTELALTLFGMTPATSGEITLEGKAVRITSPRQARDLGIAYVPEDRGQQGLVKQMAIRKNVSMALIEHFSTGIFIKAGEEAQRALAAVKRFSVRCRNIGQAVGELSGGNQQKVVIAKWLETSPKVLILDEPTRGVDVGAKAEIHTIMGELVKQGVAILMISSELPEVLGMSDRVLVISGGCITGEIARADATPERVGMAMTAHRAGEAA